MAAYDVHLRLIGKRVIDFLLVINELFSLGVMEALRANIDWKMEIAVFERVGHFGPKFQVQSFFVSEN